MNDGNVNLYLNIKINEHNNAEYDVNYVENYVNSTSTDLPPKKEVFTQVHSSNTLKRPSSSDAFNKWKRIRKYIVFFTFPYNLFNRENKRDLHFWSRSLRNLMALLFDDVIASSRSRVMQFGANPLMKVILNIAVLKRPLNRLVTRLMDIALVSVWYKNKEVR